MLQHLDQGPAGRVDGRRLATVTVRHRGEGRVKRPALGRVLLQQDGRAERPGLPEKRSQGGAYLLRAKRLVLEEGQLPAVERLCEHRVGVCAAELSE